MLLTRTFDQKAIKLQRTGKLGTYPSTLGQEAVSVGYGAAMAADDVMAPYYRDYGAQLQRKVKMEEILLYWGGNEMGSCYADNAEDFPISVPIASQGLHAVGVAKAMQYRGEKRAVVTSVGDGGTSEGDFYEAINVAGAWNLPVVFIVINNQWAISVPLSEQTACETVAQKAIAAGIEGLQVDGNDVVAVYDAVHTALNKAKAGQGATVIECLTYRLCDHTTADDASRYRPEGELEKAWETDPIERLKHYLSVHHNWDDEQDQALVAKCKQQVSEAVDIYLNTPKQPVTSIIDYMYESLPKAYQEQRDMLQRWGDNHE